MRLLYLDLDSMRPDHIGAYGYGRPITPNLDRIAAEGTRFTGCYAQATPCVPSRAALFSGRFDVHTGVVTHWGPASWPRHTLAGELRPDAPPLARHLWQHGHPTVSFSSFADRHQAWWFCAGWSELHTTGLKGGNERADEVNAFLLPWLRARARDDGWFLHVQYWDPHRNYRMPPEWLDRVRGLPPPAWPDQAAIDAHQASYGPFTASELYPFGDGSPPTPAMPAQMRTVEDWRAFVDGYDASIAFMDHHVGQVLDALDEAGVLGETAIVVSADHAEALGEFGVYGDHCNAGEAVHNIPLIVRWPGVARPGAVCRDLLYNVDLPPTLCDLLGVPVPAGWDGRSFAPQLRGDAGHPRDHLVWSHGLYACQRAVRTERWALVRTYHPGVFPLDPIALYDMAADPRQTTNLAADHPAVVAELDHRMAEWLHAQLGRHGAGVDPLQEVVAAGPFKYVRLEPWLARLERRGRAADAAAIRKRLGVTAS
jgi:choline-sulfatase